MNTQNIFLIFGPNGVGKGTLAARLAEKLGFFHLNMGNILRSWIKENNRYDLDEYIDNGNLVPDDLIEVVLEDIFKNIKSHNILADGFPRRKSQVRLLQKFVEKHNLHLSGIISLHAPLELILERLTERVLAPDGKVYHMTYNPPPQHFQSEQLKKRKDDRPEIVTKRYEEYIMNTLECLSEDFFKNIEVCNIDGTKSIDEVYEQAEEFVKRMY